MGSMRDVIVLDSSDDEDDVSEDADDFRMVPSMPAVHPEVDGDRDAPAKEEPEEEGGVAGVEQEEDAVIEEEEDEAFDSDEDEDDMPIERRRARREARAAALDPQKLLREATPEDVDAEVETLRQYWQLAVVLDFFSVFGSEVFSEETRFEAADLENALVDPCSDPKLWGLVVNTQVDLLNGCGFRVDRGDLFRRRRLEASDKDNGLVVKDNSWAWVTNRVICEWWRTLTGKRSDEASKPPFAPPVREDLPNGAPRTKHGKKSFNSFVKAVRPEVKARRPGIVGKEFEWHLRVLWRNLTDAQRYDHDPRHEPDENEVAERWYVDEMTPCQRLMTLWGLCELRLMIGADHLGPHDNAYEMGLKEPPGKFRPTPVGADVDGNQYWFRTDTLYRAGQPTYHETDSVNIPLPAAHPPYYDKDAGTWAEQLASVDNEGKDFSHLPCMQCGRKEYDAREIDNRFLLCDGCINGGHAKCMGVSVIPGGDWFCPVCDGQARIQAAKDSAVQNELKRAERQKAEEERAEREKVEREKAEREDAAARRIQTAARAWLRRKSARDEIDRLSDEVKRAAAECIQARFRAWKRRRAEKADKQERTTGWKRVEAAADKPAAMNDSEVIDLTTAEAEEEHPGPVPRSPRTVYTSTVKIHTSILKVHQEQFRRTLALFRMQVLKINPAIDPGLLFFDQPNPLNPLLPIKRRLHIDIYKLWHEVSRLGGHVRVNENNWWGIVSGICLPHMNQLDTLRRSFADLNESANMNQYPSTMQICFLKYHEVLKTFDDALILIDDTFKLDVGYTPNQLTHAKWQTWAYLQMKQGNFAEVRERNDMLTQQPVFVEYQTDRLRRQLNLFRVLSSQASGFLGASPHEFATMILGMKTHGVNSRMSLVNKAGLITGLSTDDENLIFKMKTQMAATPTEPQHNQVGAPAQLTELRAYFQLGVQQTPQSVHAEPEYEPSVLSLSGQRLSPHGPNRPVGRPRKVTDLPAPMYEPPDPFPMPPPPTSGSWECIATTPAQMATLSEALRGIDVGGLPKPVDAVPSSGSLPLVEKAIGSSDQLRLAEVLKRVASIWAVSRELVKQDREREARKQAKLEEERRLEEERHENRRLKAVADREHAILREEARLRVYDMEVRASGRGKRARKKVNYDERAFDRELNDAITDRPTRHAAARHDYERHDYEGSHDLRTGTLVNYSEADRALDMKNRDGTTTRDVTPPVSTAQESPRSDDGLGTDDDSEDETYWRRWEKNRANSAQVTLARQTSARISSPIKPISTKPVDTDPATSPSKSPRSRLKRSAKAAVLSESPESSDDDADGSDDGSDYEEELGIVPNDGRRRERRRRHVSIETLTDRSDSPAWLEVLAADARANLEEDSDDAGKKTTTFARPMRGAAAAAAAILRDPADTAKRAAAEPDSESNPASESDEPVAESDEDEEEEEEEEEEEVEEDPEERKRRERERMEHEAEEEAKRREKAAADRAKLDKMAWEAEEEADEEADKVFRLDPYSDLTPNQLFCNVVRRNILEAYPRLSPKNVNALLSTLWSKTLNLDERRNFTHILAEAKTREMDRLGREKRSKAKKAEEAAAWKETAAAFEEDEDDEEEDDDDSDDDSDYGDSD